MKNKELKTYKTGKYKDLKKYDSSDFDFLDDSGLEMLVNLLDLSTKDYWHMRYLHESWTSYIKEMNIRYEEFILGSPHYSNFLSLIEEINKTRPELYTEEDIIKEHVEQNSELYKEYYKKRSWDDPRVRNMPPGLVGYEGKMNRAMREAAIRFLLFDLNKGRGILKPPKLEILLNNEAYSPDPDSILLHNLYDEHVKPYIPRLEQYSQADMINTLGHSIKNYKRIKLGDSPLKLNMSSYETIEEYKNNLQKNINLRFDKIQQSCTNDQRPYHENTTQFLQFMTNTVQRLSEKVQSQLEFRRKYGLK